MQHLNLFKMPSNFRGKNIFIVQLWRFVHAVFFKLSPQFFYSWRRFILRLFGAKIGKKVIIRPSVTIPFPWKIRIGDYSWIGDEVVLYSLDEISIGSNTVISQRSYLCAASHDYTKTDFPIYGKKIEISDECWLATDVFIAPGVTVGKQCVIGARSSVFKNMPKGWVCYGNPAKPIKKRLE
ncbi:colanic acid biosynthesis acetyltransferase WcaF [Aureibaculum marinum]|uniref:Colanic acid biosynthesis acetyltransferase WcaF n=2 Tax=Aureibaculum marinum TaxID=2487930 RepID=A0A3N4NMQ5_9FLAO|nr:colanic acid biosynthesis acetyltransferase WcaF [Aureibaculum marinum]